MHTGVPAAFDRRVTRRFPLWSPYGRLPIAVGNLRFRSPVHFHGESASHSWWLVCSASWLSCRSGHNALQRPVRSKSPLLALGQTNASAGPLIISRVKADSRPLSLGMILNRKDEYSRRRNRFRMHDPLHLQWFTLELGAGDFAFVASDRSGSRFWAFQQEAMYRIDSAGAAITVNCAALLVSRSENGSQYACRSGPNEP